MRQRSSAKHGGVAVGVTSSVSVSSNLDPVQEKIQKDMWTLSVVLRTITELSTNNPAQRNLQNNVSNPWQNIRNPCLWRSLLQEVSERLEIKIQELVATGVTTTLISVPLLIIFNYSKAKRFK